MQLTVDDFGKMYEGEDMSIKVQNQERDRRLILFYRDMNCRYFDTFMNWRNKFKENYACSQEQCPFIRERMEHHMLERHSSVKPSKIGGIVDSAAVGGRIGTGLSSMNSRTPSGHRILGKTGASTHTLLSPIGTYKDNYTNYRNTDYFNDKAVPYSGASARVLDTNIQETLKNELKDELVNIFEDIPLNKEAMLTALADDISTIIVSDDMGTDSKIKAEIDKAVNNLLRNYPASKFDKFKLVGDVRARLFDIVKDKQQDIFNNGDRDVDNDSAYSDVSNLNDVNGTDESGPKDLTDSIKKLFENYPTHTRAKLSKESKENLLNNLIDDVNYIAKNNTMTYADKKAEIDKILDDLHSKYPENMDNHEKGNNKNEFRDKLFDLIDSEPKDLIDPIKKLFRNYPINTGTKLSQEAKDNLIKSFIDDINQVAKNKAMTDVVKKAKIEKILDYLHSKYPETTDSQGKRNFKNEIRDKLFDLIDDTEPKDLTDPIKKLFKNYPIHTGTKLSSIAKDKLLKNLIDKLNQIARDKTMTDTDKKAEMEKTLENLHSKYPETTDGPKKEKIKTEIRDKLFDLIKVKPKILTDSIKKLFENYPIYIGTKNSKEAKDNSINNLVDDINQIVRNTTMANADKKAEIEKILDDFHTKYPEPTNGEVKQRDKNEIRDKLYDLIKAQPKGSKKKWEVPTNKSFDFSGPSYKGGGARSRSFVDGTSTRSFGAPNNKTVGVSTGSGGGMNSRNIGNRTTNRLYGGGIDSDPSGAGSSRAREVYSNANNNGTIGNGVGPNDGVFGGYSGGIDNRPLATNDRNYNPTYNNDLSQEVTKFFENHPIFNHSPQSKSKKENIIRHLVEDINKLAANNKLTDDHIANEVDELVERLHVRYPSHKSAQAQYKNGIRDKLYEMICNARDNNSGRRDKNDGVGPSKKRNRSPEYDFKESLYTALDDIPIYPENKDEHRDTVINNLFDDISWIADSIKPGNDSELIREIERALDRQHLWYPGAKRDQIGYRNDIRDRLFNVIKEYNKNKPTRSPKYDKNGSIISVSTYDSDSHNTRQDARTIKYWVNQLKHEKFMQGVDGNELVSKLINRIVPILKSDNCCGKITIIKGAVLEIMSEIPATSSCNNKLQRMVNDLVNNLYCRHKNDCCSSAGSRRQTLYVDVIKNHWKSDKIKKLNKFLDDHNIAQNHDVRNEIADLIMAFENEPVDSSVECDLENDINKILKDKTINVSASEVINTYKPITNDFINDYDCDNDTDDDDDDDDGTYLNCPFTKNVSIYTSQTSCCATSTPKVTANEEVQKLNTEEIKYIIDLSDLIKSWMETLPVQFNSPEEKSFKDAVIAELAGEIMDFAKVTQITPHTKEQLDTYNLQLVVKWLNKLNVFELKQVAPQVQDFMTRLEAIPVPVLTTPHQGTRQAMDNIKVREEQGWGKDFLPKGIDVLEDEISIWVNEQPSKIFKFNKKSRNNKIHTLAETIQPKLKNKNSESELNHDLEQWLHDNIKMNKCKNLDEVKNSLKDRVTKLPGDATIAANYEEKQRERAAQAELIEKKKNEPKQARIDEDSMDIERTMKDFIVKFVDHHYDIDDPIAIRTFNYLLKRQLQRINPPVEGSCRGLCSYKEALSPQKLYEELELVKTISDWLKNVPLEKGYHTVGNRERIELVLDLARTIKAIEDESERDPCAMDYDLYLGSTIHSHFVNIPIIKEYNLPKYHATMLQQLLNRIYDWRELIAKKRLENSLDTSGINNENIGDFIEEFIINHGTEIANDEAKMEAWSIRLLREVKSIVRNAPNPKILTKSQVYSKLASVPIPGDDTVERFDRELVYIKEITEWMKNLPLLPLHEVDEQNREEEEENRRIMICDLAETIVEKQNLADDAEFKEYLTKWIQDLPLDQKRKINIPFLIDQLIHRIERTMKGNDEKTMKDNAERTLRDNAVAGTSDSKTSVSKSSSKSKNRSKSPSKGPTDSKTAESKSSSKIKNRSKSPNKQAKNSGNPGTIATDAIEKWSKSLPLKLDEATKGGIERKLYQKVGEFNSDPNAFQDDMLYETLLTVEVDEVLEKLPGGLELQKTMETQNKELVKSLVDARKLAKEKGAGDDYKHRLERTIDASIPNPVTPKHIFDPAFEIYKSRLADMFILDNFDHSNDEVKMKYERKIKDEIDKYFDSAAKRNGTRLTNHEIYNELYSALFKVPIPNEKSVMEEVEQIKTRCIIDAWVETLPLIQNDNFYEQLELDKKVETLAKRIYEIEKLPKSDEKLSKKISKWLNNVPLQPGEEGNIQKYTDKLKKELKSSTRQRKCILDKSVKDISRKDKGKSKQKKTKHGETQIPGSSSVDLSLESITSAQPKKAADLIVDIVEEWSKTLPLSSHGNIDIETIRNDVVRKVLIKISDINSNPDIFNNDCIYKDILDEELDKILNEVPKCCDFEPDEKAQLKSKLIEGVTSLKPLIKEEKSRFNYLRDLNNTVDRVLERPDNIPNDKISEYDALKEDIIENFVQIHYDKDDVEGRQKYKAKVHDDVVKFLNDIAEGNDHNPQMRMNQLLCDLAKVPVPNNEVLKEEVELVRIKDEINEFFDVNHVNKSKEKSIDMLKTSLARKLANIEKGGHNKENDDKMKLEITKTLKKLNKELKPQTIEGFVNKLKADESIRKRKITKNDPVCEESCKMLNSRRNELINSKDQQTSYEDPCAHMPKRPKLCDDATNTKNQIICDETCPHMPKKSKTCDDGTNTKPQIPYDDSCCRVPNRPWDAVSYTNNQINYNDTSPHMPQRPKTCDDTTCSSKTSKETTIHNTCNPTCSNSLRTNQIHIPKPCDDGTCTSKTSKATTIENTCGSSCRNSQITNEIHKQNKPKSCDDTSCTNKISTENTCGSSCPNNILIKGTYYENKKLQTDPQDCQSTQTENYECTEAESDERETESFETEDEDADLAERQEEICPCERKIMEMWRYYMARWRCDGPDDPFCRDGTARREMAPMGPMMAPLRRNR